MQTNSMDLRAIGNYVHEGILDGRKDFPATLEGISAQKIVATLKPGHRKTHLNGITYLSEPTGTWLLPDDCSYKRFISNSWYEDIDTDNL